MLQLIIFILITLSITNIIVREYVFEWLHQLKKPKFITKLISCPTCLGFWIGIIITLLLPGLIPIEYSLLIKIGIGGLISSICNKVLGLLFSY